MRFLTVATCGVFLGMTLMAGSAMATMAGGNTQTSTASTAHNFGGLDCPQHVPCPDASDAASSDDYAAYANACMTQSFGLTANGGFFDTNKGLDSNNCLTTKPNASIKLTSNPTAPHCCIAQSTNRSCVLHCDLVLTP